jgi:putative effector of murein hydrolase LrgA (UPF0299 family)
MDWIELYFALKIIVPAVVVGLILLFFTINFIYQERQKRK